MHPVLINETPDIPRKNDPRPQWTRSEWLNLNGLWDFAFDFGVSGKERGMQLTEIEQEQNGLYFYDRTRKFSDEIYDRIRAVNRSAAAIET